MDINIARFDLVSMRLAVLCAETGSLSAASRRAHCALSTGSHRLSALEDAVGKRLFLRDHRGLQLTEFGEVYVHHARVILERVQLMNTQLVDAPLPNQRRIFGINLPPGVHSQPPAPEHSGGSSN